MTAFTLTKIAANCSTTCSVRDSLFGPSIRRSSSLDSDGGPVSLSLPAQWLWDIIDEFIYQFQSFALFRSRPATKTDDELAMLGSEGGIQAWSSYSVLNVLYSLIQKSRVNEWFKARAEGKSEEEIE